VVFSSIRVARTVIQNPTVPELAHLRRSRITNTAFEGEPEISRGFQIGLFVLFRLFDDGPSLPLSVSA
jgi:hypothetical protein